MIGAASLTPTEQEIADRRRAFRAKIAARAVPDPGFALKRPERVIRVPQPLPKFDLGEWVQRQVTIYKPARQFWFEILADQPSAITPTIMEVQRACADYFGVKVSDLTGPSREAIYCLPRQIGYLLCREVCGRSTLEIGRRFGNRDHSSILHGARKIKRQMMTDDKLTRDYEAVRDSILVRA